MEDVKPKEEGNVDPMPPAVGFSTGEAQAEFQVAQAEEAAEQPAILDSAQSKTRVEANRRLLHKARTKRDEFFASMGSNK
ncbi:hypothetical protein D1007_31423 [Hordeum vulgare]|nr:hypothetical protein D1007_31423 [Hordeum vulgare]